MPARTLTGMGSHPEFPPITWRFVHVTDIHLGSPQSYRFQPAWNENWSTAAGQIRHVAPELVLVGGDLTRDGNLNPFEFDASRAALDALGVPWRAIPGNMDTGNKHAVRQGALQGRDDVACNVTQAQLESFRQHIGPFPWTFVHRGVRFSGCYEAVAGTTLPAALDLDRWLDGLADEEPGQWHVMLNHYPLFVDAVDEPAHDLTDPDQYLSWYFGLDPAPRRRLLEAYRRAGVTHVLSGHVHCRRPPQSIEGMCFCFGASTAMSQWEDHWADGDPRLGFHVFTVLPDRIECAFEPVHPMSTRADGWGPGGHPLPAAQIRAASGVDSA